MPNPKRETMTKKTRHGGARKGSGRKKGDETTTVSFRVKKDYADPIKLIVGIAITILDKNDKPMIMASADSVLD